MVRVTLTEGDLGAGTCTEILGPRVVRIGLRLRRGPVDAGRKPATWRAASTTHDCLIAWRRGFASGPLTYLVQLIL